MAGNTPLATPLRSELLTTLIQTLEDLWAEGIEEGGLTDLCEALLHLFAALLASSAPTREAVSASSLPSVPCLACILKTLLHSSLPAAPSTPVSAASTPPECPPSNRMVQVLASLPALHLLLEHAFASSAAVRAATRPALSSLLLNPGALAAVEGCPSSSTRALHTKTYDRSTRSGHACSPNNRHQSARPDSASSPDHGHPPSHRSAVAFGSNDWGCSDGGPPLQLPPAAAALRRDGAVAHTLACRRELRRALRKSGGVERIPLLEGEDGGPPATAGLRDSMQGEVGGEGRGERGLEGDGDELQSVVSCAGKLQVSEGVALALAALDECSDHAGCHLCLRRLHALSAAHELQQWLSPPHVPLEAHPLLLHLHRHGPPAVLRRLLSLAPTCADDDSLLTATLALLERAMSAESPETPSPSHPSRTSQMLFEWLTTFGSEVLELSPSSTPSAALSSHIRPPPALHRVQLQLGTLRFGIALLRRFPHLADQLLNTLLLLSLTQTYANAAAAHASARRPPPLSHPSAHAASAPTAELRRISLILLLHALRASSANRVSAQGAERLALMLSPLIGSAADHRESGAARGVAAQRAATSCIRHVVRLLVGCRRMHSPQHSFPSLLSLARSLVRSLSLARGCLRPSVRPSLASLTPSICPSFRPSSPRDLPVPLPPHSPALPARFPHLFEPRRSRASISELWRQGLRWLEHLLIEGDATVSAEAFDICASVVGAGPMPAAELRSRLPELLALCSRCVSNSDGGHSNSARRAALRLLHAMADNASLEVESCANGNTGDSGEAEGATEELWSELSRMGLIQALLAMLPLPLANPTNPSNPSHPPSSCPSHPSHPTSPATNPTEFPDATFLALGFGLIEKLLASSPSRMLRLLTGSPTQWHGAIAWLSLPQHASPFTSALHTHGDWRGDRRGDRWEEETGDGNGWVDGRGIEMAEAPAHSPRIVQSVHWLRSTLPEIQGARGALLRLLCALVRAEAKGNEEPSLTPALCRRTNLFQLAAISFSHRLAPPSVTFHLPSAEEVQSGDMPRPISQSEHQLHHISQSDHQSHQISKACQADQVRQSEHIYAAISPSAQPCVPPSQAYPLSSTIFSTSSDQSSVAAWRPPVAPPSPYEAMLGELEGLLSCDAHGEANRRAQAAAYELMMAAIGFWCAFAPALATRVHTS